MCMCVGEGEGGREGGLSKCKGTNTVLVPLTCD